jgi:hypothetical protein
MNAFKAAKDLVKGDMLLAVLFKVQVILICVKNVQVLSLE